MTILHIIGNRPQLIKLAPFLGAMRRYPKVKNIILHSGQHYDYEMSKIFFQELGIPDADYNLDIGSGTHGFQTGSILVKLDPILMDVKPDMVIVYGDTNTTLAGALGAHKLHLPLAHVESGVREYVWRPEEINRKIADHCSDFCLCPIPKACANLEKEGIERGRIFHTGDITYDVFLMSTPIAEDKGEIRPPREDYVLMTMHRAETVDIYDKVNGVIEALRSIPYPIVYPIHPRTKKMLTEFGLYDKLEASGRVRLIPPVGYFDFLKLLLHCRIVITDSGGVIKEAFYARKFCVTLDSSTEYKEELFDPGYNVLAGTERDRVMDAALRMLEKSSRPMTISDNPFGDGRAGEKMAGVIMDRLEGRSE